MTSASEALASNVAVRVTEFADRVAAGWGHDFHHAALAGAVADLYNDLVSFPGGGGPSTADRRSSPRLPTPPPLR